MADRASMRRRFFIPEVIQTSAMDCGPAALKALFGGFGIYLSYGRLREACQTDIDGTAIDTLETVAQQLGLDAVQILIPADLLLLHSSASLPAIVVTRLPGGGTHFVVVWRVHSPLVQVMDPAAGRLWIPRSRFLKSLYIHEQAVSREAWQEWSNGPSFTAGLEHRAWALDVKPELWGDRAHLDASLRLAQTLAEAGKLQRGAESRRFLDLCAADRAQIPPAFWTARDIENGSGDQVIMRGAVLLTAAAPQEHTSTSVASEPLPESLAAVRNEPPPRVWAPVWEALRAGGWTFPAIIVFALLTAAACTVMEALLFRGWLDLARHLKLGGQRLAALTAAIAFLGVILALEWPAILGLLRLGRHLELRLRTQFLLKIPRLSDRYFHSRLISDMAFRAHSLQLLRELPELAGQFLRHAASLLVTAAAIAWLYPGAALPAAIAVLAAIVVPILFQPALVERELRFREINSSLSRFYLDALLGVRAIQAHCAERALRAAQAGQLREWAEAGLRQQALVVRAEGVQMLLTSGAVAWLVYSEAARAQDPSGLLLLIYWAISIPSTGRQLASIVSSLPALRNTMLRFLELLGAPEEEMAGPALSPASGGVKLDIDHVTVVASGHLILDDVSLHVAPGEHVGIVGLSGAGKSSLAGLLLGWHKPVQGRVCVDDVPLDTAKLAQLRGETAWIDPQVHLFQATLFENLQYGNNPGADRIGFAIENAGLAGVLQRLPDGLQTSLGEGGGLVSGGEGQRVRIARALGRSAVRLAILDEPARGLERESRRTFLSSTRRHFDSATLFCITHDIAETLDFDRVLVMEQGRIVEEGSPKDLHQNAGSRYRELFDRDCYLHRHIWANPTWRRLRLNGGVLSETAEVRQWTHA